MRYIRLRTQKESSHKISLINLDFLRSIRVWYKKSKICEIWAYFHHQIRLSIDFTSHQNLTLNLTYYWFYWDWNFCFRFCCYSGSRSVLNVESIANLCIFWFSISFIWSEMHKTWIRQINNLMRTETLSEFEYSTKIFRFFLLLHIPCHVRLPQKKNPPKEKV